MAFVDEAKIHVSGGAGGDGSVAFHREPFKPKGGPDGGDGGDGGSVILRAEGSVGTLLELRDHPHVKAARGGHGEGKRRNGARAADRILLVPPGTVVYDDDGTLVADLANTGDQFVAARGGRGGRGNVRFATATRRAPAFADKGEPGEEASLRLELRLLADVGLIGFPNAGKSTLISRISAAKPKIADYPFTTLEPNLGVVRSGDTSFVVADIPGLIEGAHAGKGLGDRFLKHVSRAAVLVFLVDPTAQDRDPTLDVKILRHELETFDPTLAQRPSVVILTKADAARDEIELLRDEYPDAMAVSAVTGEGIEQLLRILVAQIEKARRETPPRRGYVRHISRPETLQVLREEDAWRVRWTNAERAVAMTNLDNEEALTRLQRKLISMGVERALADAGAQPGDEVRIGGAVFDFEPETLSDDGAP
ncbi:MAG: GTPase ObgE [Actinomycetota bacterium]|nr:GTPase ObgE [Actinomycetota bacterium]